MDKYKKLFEMVGESDKILFSNIIKKDCGGVFYIKELAYVLSDKFIGSLENELIAELFELVKRLNMIELTLDKDKLYKLVEHSEIKRYYMETFNGTRFATKGEIENGVTGLLAKSIEVISPEARKNLYTLLWVEKGWYKYYTQAGFTEFIHEGRIEAGSCELILYTKEQVKKALDFMDRGDYNEAIKEIKKQKRVKFDYPQFALDESTDEVGIKQIINTLNRLLPRGSKNPDYRKAIHLILKSGKTELEPMEKLFLREVHNSVIESSELGMMKLDRDAQALKDECDEIKKALENGLIKPDAFVFKIIETMDKTGYRKCSPKQHKFIEQALMEIRRAKSQESEDEDGVGVIDSSDCAGDDDDIFSIYDILGKGGLE